MCILWQVLQLKEKIEIEQGSAYPAVGLKLIYSGKYYHFTFDDISASIAQGLEHWSCKPGVVSSNLTGGFFFFPFFSSFRQDIE